MLDESELSKLEVASGHAGWKWKNVQAVAKPPKTSTNTAN
jgi:hypothetical protein